MSQHVTKYKTDDGKTRKAKGSTAKPAGKNGAQGSPGADNKNSQPEIPAK